MTLELCKTWSIPCHFWLWNVMSAWKTASTNVRFIVGGNQTHKYEINILYRVWCSLSSLQSSVGIVTRLQAGQLRYHSIPNGVKISRVSILAIQPTQPHICCVQSTLALVVKQMGHECYYLSPHPLLSLRMTGAVWPPTLMPGWHVHG